MDYKKVAVGDRVVILKSGSQRGMEHIYLKTIGIVDSIEHSYLRVLREDLHDPVRSEPLFTSFTFADFVTERYLMFTEDEYAELTPEQLRYIKTPKRRRAYLELSDDFDVDWVDDVFA